MKHNAILSVICLNMLFGCVRSEAQQAVYRKVSAEEAYKMMSESKDYVLLDVRTEAEFRQQRIAGAILIPDFELKEKAAVELPDKSKTILVYCRSGARSANSAKVLVGLGYTNVYDFGGIINWPYETVKDN